MNPAEEPETIEAILQDLSASDALVRGRAVDRLAARTLAGKRDYLQPLLADPDWVVRFKAACALAWEGDPAGGPILTEALAQPDLCFLALQALTELGAVEALPALKRFFSRRFLHPVERLQAAAALHRAGDPQAADWIRERLASPRPEEQGFALELWGRLGMPDALDRLQAVLADPGHAHRFDALRGLAALGDRRAAGLIRRVAAESGDPELAAEAAAVLAELEADR